MHVRGTLDNLAWSLLYEFAPERMPKREQDVGLFRRCIIEDEVFSDLSDTLKAHIEWHRDLKDRRDPVAHRIPLGVTSQILRPGEGETYRSLMAAYNEALSKRDFDEADNAWRKLHDLGQFAPFFAHDPNQAVVRIYPTVPDDVGRLVMICDVVHIFFSKDISAM
jgi:hypothetical protein